MPVICPPPSLLPYQLDTFEEVVRCERTEERGEILPIQPQSFCIVFEHAPVWLLVLSRQFTK